MKCRFFLLDLNESKWDGKPCIQFWGIDAEGKRILILTVQILPYFYFLAPAGLDRDTTRSKLMQDEKFSKVVDITADHRKLLGKDQTVFKVTCSDPAFLSRYAKAMLRIIGGGRSFEDLRLPVRYVTDCDFTPCEWNECDVESVEIEGVAVHTAYLATSLPRSLSDAIPPKLRTLAFTTLTSRLRGS